MSQRPPIVQPDDVNGQCEEVSGNYARITIGELMKHLAYERKRRKLFLIWRWNGSKGRPPK